MAECLTFHKLTLTPKELEKEQDRIADEIIDKILADEQVERLKFKVNSDAECVAHFKRGE
jgi:hypothetical protein